MLVLLVGVVVALIGGLWMVEAAAAPLGH